MSCGVLCIAGASLRAEHRLQGAWAEKLQLASEHEALRLLYPLPQPASPGPGAPGTHEGCTPCTAGSQAEPSPQPQGCAQGPRTGHPSPWPSRGADLGRPWLRAAGQRVLGQPLSFQGAAAILKCPLWSQSAGGRSSAVGTRPEAPLGAGLSPRFVC